MTAATAAMASTATSEGPRADKQYQAQHSAYMSFSKNPVLFSKRTNERVSFTISGSGPSAVNLAQLTWPRLI